MQLTAQILIDGHKASIASVEAQRVELSDTERTRAFELVSVEAQRDALSNITLRVYRDLNGILIGNFTHQLPGFPPDLECKRGWFEVEAQIVTIYRKKS